MLANKLLKCMNQVPTGTKNLFTAAILQAARKGTRMKREAKKKANRKEEVKKIFMPYKKRLEMEKVGVLTPRRDDSSRDYPVDDVYIRGLYRWNIFTVEEAVTLHREAQHPTMFNMPNADIVARIELSMSADKRNQFIDAFSNVILLPHQFDVEHSRTILAICKDEEMVTNIRQMNVTLSIGPEAIKMAEKGNLDFKLYDYVLCQSSMLPDLISIRNLLKKKFPSPRTGTAGVELAPIVTKFMKGIKYQVEKDKYDHDFAKIEAKIGTLEMDPKQIDDNLRALINDVENSRPKARTKRSITLVNLLCTNSRELFKIDQNQYLPPEDEEKVSAKAK